MSEALAHDIILRSLAALRERNIVPSVDIPAITLVPLEDGHGYQTPIAIALAEAAAVADIPDVSAEALAISIATYLDEVVDAVPAYAVFEHVAAMSDGMIHFYLRADAFSTTR